MRIRGLRGWVALGGCPVLGVMRAGPVIFFFFFLFGPCPRYVEVPRPATELEPEQQPEPLQ